MGAGGSLCFFKELTQETPLQRLAALGNADILLITDSDSNVPFQTLESLRSPYHLSPLLAYLIFSNFCKCHEYP